MTVLNRVSENFRKNRPRVQWLSDIRINTALVKNLSKFVFPLKAPPGGTVVFVRCSLWKAKIGQIPDGSHQAKERLTFNKLGRYFRTLPCEIGRHH